MALWRLVIADLHGPLGGAEEEFGGEQPTDRYLLGRLAPSGTMIEPDVQDEDAPTDGADLGEDQPEPIAPNITSLSPSAAGCTAYVAGDTSELAVRAEGACYERVAAESDSAAARGRRAARAWAATPPRRRGIRCGRWRSARPRCRRLRPHRPVCPDRRPTRPCRNSRTSCST